MCQLSSYQPRSVFSAALFPTVKFSDIIYFGMVWHEFFVEFFLFVFAIVLHSHALLPPFFEDGDLWIGLGAGYIVY